MKFNPIVLLTLVMCNFLFSSTTWAQKSRIVFYVEQYKSLAIDEMIRTGVPASITLAQGLLETGFGESELAVNANNHFGIKCKGEWNGERVYHDDDAKGECFRKYNSPIESYRDHSDFLSKRPHYAFLFKLEVTDYEGWAKGLKSAGYATNPQYPKLLIKLIEENNLHQYTLVALQQKNQPKPETLILAEAGIEKPDGKMSKVVYDQMTESEVAESNVETPIFSNEVPSQYPEGIFTVNESKAIFVESGTSLFALASNNNIAYNKLLDFNDLSKVDIINKAQLVFLQKKQKRGSKDVHIVGVNENLYDICQKEGIQLSALLELNNFEKNMTLAIGQRLFLKPQFPVSSKSFSNSRNIQTSAALR